MTKSPQPPTRLRAEPRQNGNSRHPGPVSFAGAPARQANNQTCGAASLAYVISRRDSVMNEWLEQDPDRFGALQLRLHTEATSVLSSSPCGQRIKSQLPVTVTARFGWVNNVPAVPALGLRLPLWPRALGTPPWGLAKQANLRTPKRRGKWRVTWANFDPASTANLAVDSVQVNPIFLYVADSLRSRPLRPDRWAVPRHVVVLVGRTRKLVFIYEPSSAQIHSVPIELFRSGTLNDQHKAAFGGWRTVVALVS